MPLDPRDRRALNDVIRFARSAITYGEGLTLEGFTADEKSQHAAMYAIATTAEAANKLSDQVLRFNPTIPWPIIRGMRNILIHEYGRVDLTIVHRVITEHLPDVVAQVEQLKARLEET